MKFRVLNNKQLILTHMRLITKPILLALCLAIAGCATPKKILYLITFPFFMTTYIPIVIASLFYKPKWTPIAQSVTMSSLQDKKDADLGSVVQTADEKKERA